MKTDPLLDSTNISGTVLKCFPIGRLLGFVRSNDRILAVWKHESVDHGMRFGATYIEHCIFDVLTGEEVEKPI